MSGITDIELDVSHQASNSINATDESTRIPPKPPIQQQANVEPHDSSLDIDMHDQHTSQQNMLVFTVPTYMIPAYIRRRDTYINPKALREAYMLAVRSLLLKNNIDSKIYNNLIIPTQVRFVPTIHQPNNNNKKQLEATNLLFGTKYANALKRLS